MSFPQRRSIDPITLGLIRNFLSSVADEMANTIIRSAYSTIVRDCMDFSTGLCDRHGNTVAQGLTIPFQLGGIPFALEATLRKYRDNIHPGDIFIINDPFEGGIHIPDVFLFEPVFYESQLIGFSAVVSHHLDLGGRVPGSVACDNTEIFHDGLRIPPLKLYEKGVPSEALFAIIEKNIRIPVMTLGDIRSNLAACRTGARGLIELAEQYSVPTLETYFDELLNYTERLARAEIRAWPNGDYQFTDYLDNDGVDPGPIPLSVKLTIADDAVVVDFEGTSPQVRGGINSPWAYTVSCCAYAIRSVMQADIPNTSGLLRPLKVIAAEGLIVNPRMPAASGMRGIVGFRLADALLGALAQALPDRVPAAGEGGNSLVIIGGCKPGATERFIMFDMVCGTWGARPGKDGNDGLTNPGSVISNIPTELMELEYPVRLNRYSLENDSGGAGKYRGGLGVTREWVYLGDSPASLSVRTDRRDFPPYGLAGGGMGAPSSLIVNPGTAQERILETKVTTTLQPGDVLRHTQAGGGGWGDPRERDAAAVMRDVVNEKVSIEKARELYGVVIDRATMRVDFAATLAGRQHERAPAAGLTGAARAERCNG
jgi:N-methylhydantoinase B